MKQFLLKFQVVFEAILLLVTLGGVYLLIHNYQYRWDFTREKVYSLPQPTIDLLKDLKKQRLDIFAFYPQDDPARQGLEIFLKQCQRYHPEFHYNFYDPNRRPALAQQFNVQEPYTVLIRSADREERIVNPTEESFANAFLRTLHPKNIHACFVAGHGEFRIDSKERNGIEAFREVMEGYNVQLNEIVLSRDHVPDVCQVVVVGGPRWELSPEEYADLKKAFNQGKGILALVDPMDPGTGQTFISFFKEFGVVLGENVIVDKVSRVVGGDFLMPVVSSYMKNHPAVYHLKEASFFPITRTVQPSTESSNALEVSPLAMTNSGSWAETNLTDLENGKSDFDATQDIAGPLPVAVAVEKKSISDKDQEKSGRMVVVGDSDFLTNGYLNLSSNKEFGLSLIRWLAKDDRFVSVQRSELKFKPLLIGVSKRTKFLILVLLVYPLVFLIAGVLYLWIRSKGS